MAYTYSKIASVTVGSGGVSSIDFLAIPQNYTDLVLKISARTTGYASVQDYAKITINANTQNVYSVRHFYGTGTTTASGNNMDNYPAGGVWAQFASDNATASTFGNSEMYIFNYSSDKYKPVSADMVSENNATAAQLFLRAGLFSSSAPITNISIAPYYGTSFVQYSTATLYGIRAEV